MHGYTGSPNDLTPLAGHLMQRFGDRAVRCVRLPGHENRTAPRFDTDLFLKAIAEAAQAFRCEGRPLVMIGHSTGGTLALASILKRLSCPDMLVLAATPRKVDGSGLTRWETHRKGKPNIALGDVARMVSLINQIGDSHPVPSFSVLVLHGETDALAPPADVKEWICHGFPGPVRHLMVPDAGHDLFHGKSGLAAADWIARAARDMIRSAAEIDSEAAAELKEKEGAILGSFLDQTPQARRHLLGSPGARRALGRNLELTRAATTDPIQINLEVTTRCNMRCPHCARALYGHSHAPQDMPLARFQYLLDLLPNSYRIVLAGLGEPTLHPQIVTLVSEAAVRKRRIGLVTNGSALNRELSRDLIAAGLSAITFSLDSSDAATAAVIRPGTRLEQVLDNIRSFIKRASGAGVATAVFTAVSSRTVAQLPQLAATVSSLGVQAWMWSDLNFEQNREYALNQRWHPTAMSAAKHALRIAFRRKLPVLCVQALEEFGLAARYREYLLYPPAHLAHRSGKHIWCLSPWQTLPVDVEGNATLCDCRPLALVGNLLERPLSDVWNGKRMQAWRSRMTSKSPPAECLACPRF